MPEYTYEELKQIIEGLRQQNEEFAAKIVGMENDIRVFSSAVITTIKSLGFYPMPEGANIMALILKKIPGLVIKSQTNPEAIKEQFSAFTEVLPFLEKYKHLIEE
jgi:hypothetical protein